MVTLTKTAAYHHLSHKAFPIVKQQYVNRRSFIYISARLYVYHRCVVFKHPQLV